MKVLNQAFDEAAENALPHPMEDAYLDAVHTKNMIEFEPEYHAIFDNPDIDEKPPMSLEKVLQKEAVEDVMARAPCMIELIDMYSGPDVVTAKQQEVELQRVANTLPENMPSSEKRFTDKTLLSLKNNPAGVLTRNAISWTSLFVKFQSNKVESYLIVMNLSS